MTDWKSQAREVYGCMGRAEATFPPGQAEIDCDILAAALERAVAQERERCAKIVEGWSGLQVFKHLAAAIRSVPCHAPGQRHIAPAQPQDSGESARYD